MDSKTDFELNLNLEIISFDFYSSCQRSSWMHVFSSSYKNYARFRKTKITETVPKIKIFCFLWADSKQLKYPYFILKVPVLKNRFDFEPCGSYLYRLTLVKEPPCSTLNFLSLEMVGNLGQSDPWSCGWQPLSLTSSLQPADWIKILNCYLILYFYFLAVTIKLMKKG